MSTTNADIPARAVPDGAERDAVMQSLSENKFFNDFYSYAVTHNKPATLQNFCDYCHQLPKQYFDVSGDADMQILESYLSKNPDAKKYEVINYTKQDGEGAMMTIANQKSDGTRDVFIAFAGTGSEEWYDNAQGMVETSTLQQRKAASYYDQVVEQAGITEADNVVITGHSKGGNKAMYVTMASRHADLVDSCLALDGQGFSPEAIAQWQKIPERYEERRNKITLVAGQNDYVHVLGECIVPRDQIYYVDYCGDNLDIAAYHTHEHLFAFGRDGRTYTCSFNKPTTQGEFSQYIQETSNYLMSLPSGERFNAAVSVMSLLANGTLDGFTPSLEQFISGFKTTLDYLLHSKPFVGEIIDGVLARQFPAVTAIKLAISFLEDLQAAYEARKREKAAAKANSLAAQDDHIYVDCVELDRIGRSMMVYSDDYARLRDQMNIIKTELSIAWDALKTLVNNAKDLFNNLAELAEHARNSLHNLLTGDILGAVDEAISGFNSACESLESAKSLVMGVINSASAMLQSLDRPITRTAELLFMLSTKDVLSNMGKYMTSTADEFTLADDQFTSQMNAWGV